MARGWFPSGAMILPLSEREELLSCVCTRTKGRSSSLGAREKKKKKIELDRIFIKYHRYPQKKKNVSLFLFFELSNESYAPLSAINQNLWKTWKK